jgi:hypothetical protein
MTSNPALQDPSGRSSGPHARKLPAAYYGVVQAFLLTFFMTAIVSAIATWSAIGLTSHLPMRWLAAWGVSWCIAFPTVLFVLPMVRRMVAAVVETPQAGR